MSKDVRKSLNETILNLNKISNDKTKEDDVREYTKGLAEFLYGFQGMSFAVDRMNEKLNIILKK